MITDPSSRHNGFADAVLRHRRAITIIAAACALPYALSRMTWLTPWPLFGGSAEMFAADPSVRVLGLALGAGMLAGGVLTLGLILPWGERFPRFLAGVGGRAVPPALAIIPASLVSVLFTAAGIPFWLWGPLLGFATWAYALTRADAARLPTPSGTRSAVPRS
jgi:hypothetical protein